MDHQRTTFYGMRQQVLEGREVDEVIWGMIGDAIRDAVDKYITRRLRRRQHQRMGADQFRGDHRRRAISAACATSMSLKMYIKDQARAEAETNITATLGEFMGEDDDRRRIDWDAKGLSSWAMSRFHVNLPQNQIRKMDAEEVEERLREAAVEQINQRDCSRAAEISRAALCREGAGGLGQGEIRRSRLNPQEMLVRRAR